MKGAHGDGKEGLTHHLHLSRSDRRVGPRRSSGGNRTQPDDPLRQSRRLARQRRRRDLPPRPPRARREPPPPRPLVRRSIPQKQASSPAPRPSPGAKKRAALPSGARPFLLTTAVLFGAGRRRFFF